MIRYDGATNERCFRDTYYYTCNNSWGIDK